MDYASFRGVLDGERMPAALVDLGAFDRNAARLEALVGEGQTLRVASKSVRVPALLRRVLDRGAPWQGIMCFSAEEAAFLHGEGFDVLLVAYPTLLSSDLAALRSVHEAGGAVTLMVDSRPGLDALAAAMTGVERPFAFALEIDVSLKVLGLHLGVRRSPLRGAADILPLVEAAPAHLRFAGLMAYEAQVAGLADQSPHHRAQNPAASLVRKRSVKAVARQRQEVFEALRDAGHTPALFNGAGTGSMSFARGESCLTELTAGSGLLCPHLFDHYSNLELEPAAFFAVQVVRKPAPGFATCLGGGYVASGTPGWDKVPVPWLPKGLKLVSAEGCGEVQTPLEVPKGLELAPGDPVIFRHAKAGELAERFAEYLLVEDGQVSRAPTYRGLGRCFF